MCSSDGQTLMLSFPWNSVLHVACTAFFDKAFLLSEAAWRRALFHTQAVQLLVASALRTAHETRWKRGTL